MNECLPLRKHKKRRARKWVGDHRSFSPGPLDSSFGYLLYNCKNKPLSWRRICKNMFLTWKTYDFNDPMTHVVRLQELKIFKSFKNMIKKAYSTHTHLHIWGILSLVRKIKLFLVNFKCTVQYGIWHKQGSSHDFRKKHQQ